MYLTKISMPLQNRKTVECLQNSQKMHCLITSLFGSRRSEQNILFRVHSVQGRVQIYIYSDGPVTKSTDVEVYAQRDISDWLNGFVRGQVLPFDLLASPTKKIEQPDGKNSQRRVLRTPEERSAWLARKGEQYGFTIQQFSEMEHSKILCSHKQEAGGKMAYDAYHFQGVLQIVDVEKFKKAIAFGIGPGKAYGLGMLMVR